MPLRCHFILLLPSIILIFKKIFFISLKIKYNAKYYIYVTSRIIFVFSMNSVVKNCGQHLKAPIALVRLRLYETLSLIPAQDFEGKTILFYFFLNHSFTTTL